MHREVSGLTPSSLSNILQFLLESEMNIPFSPLSLFTCSHPLPNSGVQPKWIVNCPTHLHLFQSFEINLVLLFDLSFLHSLLFLIMFL
jgi:hypothetical protein